MQHLDVLFSKMSKNRGKGTQKFTNTQIFSAFFCIFCIFSCICRKKAVLLHAIYLFWSKMTENDPKRNIAII